MENLEDSFKAAMNLVPVLMLVAISGMLRPIITPELEKRLGRKLTDEEWHYYLQESYQKSKTELQQETFRQWCQRLIDRKIIHDFVWNKEEREPV